MSASSEERAKAIAHIQEVFNQVRKAGIVILAGIDSSNYCKMPGISLLCELKQLEVFGMTKAEVLCSAALSPAQVFNMPDDGEIKPDFMADFIVLKDNPLEKLDALKTITGVFSKGVFTVLINSDISIVCCRL